MDYKFLDNWWKKNNYHIVDINDNQKNQIDKLLIEHNSKLIVLHQKIGYIGTYLEEGIEDIYERIHLLIKLKNKSQSLEMCCLRHGDRLGKIIYEEHNEKTKHTLSNYKKRYGEVEGPEKFEAYKKTKSCSLSNCIRRYGEVEGTKFYTEFWESTTFGVSEEKYIRKFGEEKGIEEFNKLKRYYNDRYTIDWFEKKYGKEKGLDEYISLNSRKSEKTNKKALIRKLRLNGATDEDI